MNKKNKHGFTLIEILIGITIFVFIGIIVASMVLSSVRNSTKSDSQSRVRAAMDNAVQVMERQLRNAQDVSCFVNKYGVIYTDQVGIASTFFRKSGGGYYYIASGSASQSTNLTGTDVKITGSGGYFTCTAADVSTGTPAKVRIKFSAKTQSSITGVAADSINVDTVVNLRNK